MITYVDGDLLKMRNDFDVIAHGCNCFNNFGGGFALQIKNTIPEAWLADQATIAGDESKLGTITFTETVPAVVNIYSQYNFGGRRHGKIDLDYDALRSGLKALKDKYSGKRIAMNKIGSDLAGGDWDIIEQIIKEEMVGEYVTIVNYVK